MTTEPLPYLANPATFLTSSSQRRRYIVDGGNTLYHVHFKDGSYIVVNVLVFADTPAKAVASVVGAMRFGTMCHNEYKENEGHPWHFADKSAKVLELYERGEYLVQEAPRNQLFKVAWAGNDHI